MSDTAVESPRERLHRIYTLYDLWARDFSFACTKGCSTCCTRSVSLTMLEAEEIGDFLREKRPDLLDTARGLPPSPLDPPTTNEFAAACLRREEMELDTDWDMRPCLFLEDDCCGIYPARPFMCRSLGSKVPCHLSGAAEMEPLFLTLNTLVMQYLEHLDQGRPWGNLHAILPMALSPGRTGTDDHRISLPIPGLLVLPEEEPALHNHLRTLDQIISGP
ncbi:MAG: hypothetical protein Kow0089_08710 [Desulfobulbaceae bacterium]